MTLPATKRATSADLEALPSTVVGELIEGVLYTMPRPRPRHAQAAGAIFQRTKGPYDLDGGGWWIFIEPGVRIAQLDVEEIVPDIAGWRRERLPTLPDTSISVVPDWVCEVLSPSTRAHDLKRKRPLYAKAGVQWMWIVDVDARTLTASRLEGDRWLELGVWSDDDEIRAAPFDDVAIRGQDLWGSVPIEGEPT